MLSLFAFLKIDFHGGRQQFTIFESVILDCKTALFVLQLLRKGIKQEIIIYSHHDDMLVQLAKDLGSTTIKGDQYLLRIHNPSEFCRTLKPVFEHRLQESEVYDITSNLIINFFRNAIQIKINNSKITDILDMGFVDSSMGADGGDMCIPPDAFLRLAFGYRNLDQLKDAWPDIVVKSQSRYLIEILFPTMSSHIYTPYHYQLINQKSGGIKNEL